MANASLLGGEWVHVHEEDGPDGRVFRRAGVPLPPSRGRQRLSFNPDGTAVESGPGADDRTASQAISWSVDGQTIVLRSSGGGTERRYSIAKLEPDRLILRDT